MFQTQDETISVRRATRAAIEHPGQSGKQPAQRSTDVGHPVVGLHAVQRHTGIVASEHSVGIATLDFIALTRVQRCRQLL